MTAGADRGRLAPRGDVSAGRSISAPCREIAGGKASNSRTRLATERAHDPTRTSIPHSTRRSRSAVAIKPQTSLVAPLPRMSAQMESLVRSRFGRNSRTGVSGSIKSRPSHLAKNGLSRVLCRLRETSSATQRVRSAGVGSIVGISDPQDMSSCTLWAWAINSHFNLDQTWIEQRRWPSGCIRMALCGRRRGAQGAQLLDLSQYLFPQSVMGSTHRLLSWRPWGIVSLGASGGASDDGKPVGASLCSGCWHC